MELSIAAAASIIFFGLSNDSLRGSINVSACRVARARELNEGRGNLLSSHPDYVLSNYRFLLCSRVHTSTEKARERKNRSAKMLPN